MQWHIRNLFLFFFVNSQKFSAILHFFSPILLNFFYNSFQFFWIYSTILFIFQFFSVLLNFFYNSLQFLWISSTILFNSFEFLLQFFSFFQFLSILLNFFYNSFQFFWISSTILFNSFYTIGDPKYLKIRYNHIEALERIQNKYKISRLGPKITRHLKSRKKI